MVAPRTGPADHNLRRDLMAQLKVAGRVLAGSAEWVRDPVEAMRIDRRLKSRSNALTAILSK